MRTGINFGACAMVVLLFGWPAHAETALQKMRAAERAADAELASRERVCNARFVVASCVEKAQRDHRVKLADLRSEAAAVDEARRRSLADTRREAIADKVKVRQAEAKSEAQSETESGTQGSASEARKPRSTPAARIKPRKLDMSPLGSAGPLMPKRVPHKPAPKPPRPLLPSAADSAPQSATEREAAASRQREKFETRNREIEAHKADVLRRRADRQAQGRLAPPLPLPPGASSPP